MTCCAISKHCLSLRPLLPLKRTRESAGQAWRACSGSSCCLKMCCASPHKSPTLQFSSPILRRCVGKGTSVQPAGHKWRACGGSGCCLTMCCGKRTAPGWRSAARWWRWFRPSPQHTSSAKRRALLPNEDFESVSHVSLSSYRLAAQGKHADGWPLAPLSSDEHLDVWRLTPKT